MKHSRLCTICARGGSKGVKGKNIRLLQGKPLLAISLLQAKKSGLFDLIAVSSDSPEILGVAKDWGADFCITRPEEMASDVAGKIPAILHCLLQTEELSGKKFNTLVDLDATSPLRKIEDIQGAVELMESNHSSNVISGAPARRSPYFNLVEMDAVGNVKPAKHTETPILRRQDAPRCFDMNASIYVWDRIAFVNDPRLFYPDTKLFSMPEDRSLDIDSELDFALVDFIAEKKGRFQYEW